VPWPFYSRNKMGCRNCGHLYSDHFLPIVEGQKMGCSMWGLTAMGEDAQCACPGFDNGRVKAKPGNLGLDKL
jgi:hypothetical protein